ncbi:sensor histidine kinase [Paenibacillus senegalensis]|uniref:sensor histidine kinase n=1 Tax=Paenibacillus senegalensis TaxID=1465766 RepID=UPI001F2CEDCC|nr:HAMP domain-containing sensor histidine kinase [Paenibacillus senegalensis]
MVTFFRRMNVLLFLAFFCFSIIFILILMTLYNVHWEQMFNKYHTNLLNSNVYKLMDDMRSQGISGQLSIEEEEWLRRRANLYGILVQYSDLEQQRIFFDTISEAEGVDLERLEPIPYVIGGKVSGQVTSAHLVARKNLSPAMIEYQETMKARSKLIYTAVLVVSLLFSLWIARMLSRHLTELEEQTNLIRMGKRELNFAVKGPEEVRKLALTMDGMVKELKKQEDWRQHLMEDLTHELRTPLTSMLSQVEAIQDGIYQPDEERMSEIYEELERLSRLINDMERLSEAESAKFSLNIQRTDMVKLVRRVFENFQPLARNKSIQLTFEGSTVPCFCEVDRDKTIQIMSNIVSNAIKYNQAGGTVHLSVSCGPDDTFLVCEDTGIGISEEDLPYIFNRLYRADKSRSRFNSGVGLGLSIVKALVEAHHGEVSAVSCLGQGSIFTVRIPSRYRRPEEKRLEGF